MEKTANKAAAKKQAVRFFCVTMAILLVSSIFIWGFQSGWGAVKIKRITITGDNGSMISSLAYDDTIEESEKIGACGFIFKPVEKAFLLETLGKCFPDVQ